MTCRSDGTWVSENPACECRLGYEDRETECFSKCMRQSCWTILCYTCIPKGYCVCR